MCCVWCGFVVIPIWPYCTRLNWWLNSMTRATELKTDYSLVTSTSAKQLRKYCILSCGGFFFLSIISFVCDCLIILLGSPPLASLVRDGLIGPVQWQNHCKLDDTERASEWTPAQIMTHDTTLSERYRVTLDWPEGHWPLLRWDPCSESHDKD